MQKDFTEGNAENEVDLEQEIAEAAEKLWSLEGEQFWFFGGRTYPRATSRDGGHSCLPREAQRLIQPHLGTMTWAIAQEKKKRDHEAT